MTDELRKKELKAYESYAPTSTPFVEILAKIIFVVVVAGFVGLGLFFNTIEPLAKEFVQKIRMKTEFIIDEKKKEKKIVKKIEKKKEEKKEKPKPKPKPEPKKEEKPIDLTKEPKLDQKIDDIKPEKKVVKKKVRRVYGLKKVYSSGLGSGGATGSAVVGKFGNTTNKDIDTVTATKEEVKGEVASITTISTAPQITKRVKPVYTKAMRDNQVAGKIKVRILVDIDGKVKKAKVLNDLGHGSKEEALNAAFKTEFKPAMRGDKPVASWISITVTFIYLG